MKPTKAIQEKYMTVHTILADEYGFPSWRQHLAPIDELVSTILSQNTSDLNRDKAYDALKAGFPSWEAVMDAPEEAVVDAIRPAGLANQKGPRIQQALRQVQERSGELTLDFLAELSLDEAKRWLTDLNGVGPKTAAIVMLFAFGRPAFPVDTHIHRVSGRLGLIGSKITADKAHDILENIGYPETYYAFHLNVIRHGREICKARKPNCRVCVLRNHCNFYLGVNNE